MSETTNKTNKRNETKVSYAALIALTFALATPTLAAEPPVVFGGNASFPDLQGPVCSPADDLDGDGICTAKDNCRAIPNASQFDSDFDGGPGSGPSPASSTSSANSRCTASRWSHRAATIRLVSQVAICCWRKWVPIRSGATSKTCSNRWMT